MIPTHKECVNFRGGVCALLGIPVNPNGPACPRFTAKTQTVTTTITYQPPYPQQPGGVAQEVDFDELRRRLDRMEETLRKIKAMLESI